MWLTEVNGSGRENQAFFGWGVMGTRTCGNPVFAVHVPQRILTILDVLSARTKPLARRTLPRGVNSKHQSAGLERLAVQRYDDVDINDKAQQ
jgi:hypothetical protein